MTSTVEGKRSGLSRLSSLGRIVGLVKPYRARFYSAALILLLSSAVGLAYPQAAKMAVDLGMRDGSFEKLNQLALGLLALVALQGVFVWVRHYLMSSLGERVVADLRRRVFDHLLTLDAAWFHERRTGELVGRLAADVAVIEGVVGSELSFALRSVVQLAGGLAFLCFTNFELTLTMLAIVPALAIGAVVFGRAIRRMSQRVQDELARASGQVQEAIGAIATVQAFVREPQERERYGSGVESAYQESLRLLRWRSSFFSGVTIGGYLAVISILWVGGRQVVRGELSSGELVAFLLYTAIVASGLVSVASLWSSLERAAGATLRLFDILDTSASIASPERPRALPPAEGHVQLRDVSFRYHSAPEREVLSHVELEVKPGQIVALVGPSGGGKTTIASLILRLYDVGAGAVTLDGVDVRELSLADLRGAIAWVPQEPVLFSGTIRDNIAFGRTDASDADIRSAARDARADEFIERFPTGFETLVGERGVKLSGGQRQRIAIARALLRDPRLLILDEATSSLDAESEALVQDALSRLMRGRTTLVIAHRLSTVRDADRIVVLERGHIVEQGTHDSLMAKSGVYKKLVEHQLTAKSSPQAVAIY